MLRKLQERLNDKLLAAVDDGDYQEAKKLLQSGADVHVRDDYCICSAVSNGYSKLVNILINHGANVSIYGNYPIRDAIIKEHDGTLGVICKTAVLNESVLQDALRMAVAFNKVKSLKVILDYCELTDELFERYVEQAISAREQEMAVTLVLRSSDVKSHASRAIEIAKYTGTTMSFMEPFLKLTSNEG